ncbi:MAG TPA: NADH-quinone oxidoreductase subunit C/D [Bacteroidales bacterium]|nr:NADH-quinone oxidoreductase subunit C/D [Bacteroidales bacterium]
MNGDLSLVSDIRAKLGSSVILNAQDVSDDTTTIWVNNSRVKELLSFLKTGIDHPFNMLYDLTAIDERRKNNRQTVPESDFTIVYHLTSLDRNQDLRIKTPLKGEYPSTVSVTGIWPSANWYEREIYDMFGVGFEDHPNLRRILLPSTWKGHPLRKEYPARATEMGPFVLNEQMRELEDSMLQFRPEEWGLKPASEDTDFMFLNIGPQHPGTHGLLRLVLQLDGEHIVELVPDIGFHHRGAEKMGERQSWHTFIPYTDRIDYLGGVLNNLPYVLSVEKIAGIKVPDRVNVIRIMMCELFRIASHLVWLGTYAQDLGQMSPVFYAFNDRERIYDIVGAITGGRMHPSWFRIGGVAHDLPDGWDKLIRDFLDYFPKQIKEFEKVVILNRIFRERTVGIGVYTAAEAIEWGVTGVGLRSAGVNWDYRKKRPYSGYENFEFEIPLGKNGDCFDRSVIRMEEMRQSLRIIKQCLDNMPAGSYKSDHPLTTPPLKEKTMQDIETLITHFLGVTWGPVIPPGEAMIPVEASKGSNGYYLVSDGNTSSYRSRIRTPTFAHVQMLPLISRGYTIPDLLSILGAMDLVLADLDR